MAILTEEMRKQAIGLKGRPVSIEIEKGMIQKFIEAVGDDNPQSQDTEKARTEAPPGLFHTLMFQGNRPDLPFELPFKGGLDGGGEWEYLAPTWSGDTLTVVTTIADVYERQGSSGPMVFLVRETTWTNQNGKTVARAKGTTILR